MQATTIAATAAGVLLILTALRDIFDALFHPEGKGALSRVLMRAVWRLFRALGGDARPAVFSLAGPLALLSVIGSWALMLLLGWTLIVWPHMPESYEVSGASSGSFADSLYLSLTTLTTLGYGDIVPQETWLRLVGPLEALVGFGLLTASISWLLAIYPALSRRRSLAYELHILEKAENETGLAALRGDSEAAERILDELTSRLVAVERDMVMFPMAYYFPESDSRFSLPVALPYLVRLAERGTSDEMPPNVRLRAAMLRDAVEDLAGTIAARFHGEDGGGSVEELIDAYMRDHRPRRPGT